jgi:hypothetical protein
VCGRAQREAAEIQRVHRQRTIYVETAMVKTSVTSYDATVP